MDKKTSLKINNRTETIFGLASLSLGIMSLLIFILVVYISAYHSEGKQVLLGVVELGAMLMCLVGFVFLVSLVKPDLISFE